MIESGQFLVLNGAFAFERDPRSTWVWVGPGSVAVFLLQPDEVLSVRDPLGGRVAQLTMWQCTALGSRGGPRVEVQAIESPAEMLRVVHDDTGCAELEARSRGGSATGALEPARPPNQRDNLGSSLDCLRVDRTVPGCSLAIFADEPHAASSSSAPGDVVALEARTAILASLRPSRQTLAGDLTPSAVEFTIGPTAVTAGGLGERSGH